MLLCMVSIAVAMLCKEMGITAIVRKIVHFNNPLKIILHLLNKYLPMFVIDRFIITVTFSLIMRIIHLITTFINYTYVIV